jgi:ribosome-associated protein
MLKKGVIMFIKFSLAMLESGHIELVKLLKATGVFSSGGTAKTAISEGKVRVDGIVELRKGRKIRRGQKVEFKGSTIQVE